MGGTITSEHFHFWLIFHTWQCWRSTAWWCWLVSSSRESAFQYGADYSDLENKGLPVKSLEAIQIYFELLSLNFICALFGQTSVLKKKDF